MQGGLHKAQMDCRAAQWLDQECSGVSSVQHARPRKGQRRVQACVHGAEFAQDGFDADGMSNKDSEAIDWPLRGRLKPSQREN